MSDLTFERRMAFLGLFDCLAALVQLASARSAVKMGKKGGRIFWLLRLCDYQSEGLERLYVHYMQFSRSQRPYIEAQGQSRAKVVL